MNKKTWSFIGLFLMTLIITLPFYSANALATSIQITKNTGEAGIDSYIDAQGDAWTVEALISGSNETTIDPNSVKIKIGENEAAFSSCSGGPLGITCQYLSPLTDGVKEVEYAFQAVYNFVNVLGLPDSVSDGAYIRADGSAPEIKELKISQGSDGQVHIDFTANDKYAGKPAVGIKKIEISNPVNGQVIQTIMDIPLGKETFDYVDDTNFGGILQGVLEGEGIMQLRVSAEDWLGHKTTAPPIATFKADFIKPDISANSLNFTGFGKFIGPFDAPTDITIKVKEKNGLTVVGYSEQATLNGQEAECSQEEEVWDCRWKEVMVKAGSSVSVNVVATDAYGNVAEETIVQDFVPDSSAPEIIFFGSERTFDGESYVKNGDNKVLLVVKEQGAGIDADGVRANLGALGGGGAEEPTACEQSDTFNCYWDTHANFGSEGIVRISLSRLQDKVANTGEMPEIELKVDNSPPKIEKLEFYGVSEVGDKDYFQSNDQIKIKAKVSESSGLFFLLNLNGIVMDAETNYPENVYTEDYGAGWAVFSEQNCIRDAENFWICELLTEPIKSGPDKNVALEMVITDTAGNEAKAWPEKVKNMDNYAKKGTYKFDLNGLSLEDQPDYWEVAKNYPRPVLQFVDLDTTSQAYTRMPLELRLQSNSSLAKVLRMELLPNSCAPVGEVVVPEISRSLLYGGSNPDGQASPVAATLILEFSPFDGRQMFGLNKGKFETAKIEYTCKLRIYSLVGKNALQTAEVQEVRASVPFGFSALGAIDENLADKVRDLKGDGLFKFASALSYAEKVIEWLKYIANIITIITAVDTIVNLFGDLERKKADTGEKVVVTAPISEALRGTCMSSQYQLSSSWLLIAAIQIPTKILSCTPDPSNLGWYGTYQKSVLEFYNLASGRNILGVDATSLYDNMYTSALGLCVPGIMFNIEKAREIYCRKIVCYGREVPSGIATLQACDQLYDLQMCEFFWGPAFDFTPIGAIGRIGQMIKDAFRSPLGLIALTEILGCAKLCWVPESPGWLTTCKITTGINRAIEVVDSVVGMVKSRPDVTGSPYCKMAEDIDPDDLTGGSDYVKSAQPAEETPPVEAVAPTIT